MSGFSEDPQAPYGLPRTKQEFFAWLEHQERRFEFKDGQVLMHPGVSRNHMEVVAAFLVLFRAKLDKKVWASFPADLAVEIGDDVRYPDILIERRGGVGHDRLSSEPTLLVEVLSPSTTKTDFGAKFNEYTSLASLQAYIIASQDEPMVWVWQRGRDGAFAKDAEVLTGAHATIKIRFFNIELALSEIYDGITA
jgi:Uma2 family endonuclease